jgi:hypothetical protein
LDTVGSERNNIGEFLAALPAHAIATVIDVANANYCHRRIVAAAVAILTHTPVFHITNPRAAAFEKSRGEQP